MKALLRNKKFVAAATTALVSTIVAVVLAKQTPIVEESITLGFGIAEG